MFVLKQLNNVPLAQMVTDFGIKYVINAVVLKLRLVLRQQPNILHVKPQQLQDIT